MIIGPETILNVDDTEQLRYAKTRLLIHAGYDVLEAATGAETLELVNARRPALVLLDVNLPDMSGLDVCARIKAHMPEVLVLQTSAHFVSADHRVRGLEGGADAYLTQPVDPAEMIATVKALLRIRRAEERLRRSEARMRLAQQAGGVGTWEWDLDSGIVVWSEANSKLIGSEPGGAMNFDTLLACVHPEDRSLYTEALAASAQTGTPLDCEFRVLHGDGSTRWLMSRADIHGRAQGLRGRLVGINIDLTLQKQADLRQRVLIQELHHRVKNTLAIVQSIARQTLRDRAIDPGALESFEGRLANLAKTHDLLMREDLIGGTLHAIVAEAIAPYAGGSSARFRVSGPVIQIAPRVAVPIAMALHELGTNASKYGALSRDSGSVAVSWEILGESRDRLAITWVETGGPPVEKPTRQGFGSRLIERVLAHELGGATTLDYREDGLVCRIEVVLDPEF
ncbi:sensor histidine kinase [Chthonobacter albigriseus]|uniref:sensor histidine kinase n=1 Tax=Chthonobacter albigriseus TaxID=1683161 RepID=UPI0015EEBC80|nr:HWE histidine kinase domain-containing protein [Chthonobacter albigriseus]